MSSSLPGASKPLRGQYAVLVLHVQFLLTSASEAEEYTGQEPKQDFLVKYYIIKCTNLY